MPKINIYLPDELAKAVREIDIPVSSVCQRALADAVAAADGPVIGGAGDAGVPPAGELSRFTRRARVAIDHARSTRARPTSVDLVQGILAEGNNLALRVLNALEIEPDDLVAELHGRNRQTDAHAGALAHWRRCLNVPPNKHSNSGTITSAASICSWGWPLGQTAS